MNSGYIALLDSGIGGLSLLLELVKVLPNERFLYFGDNDNAPYGNKSNRDLKRLTEKNVDYIKRYNVKIIVVACNTLSVNLLKEIEAYSGLPTFGVFPPVESATCFDKNVLLLSTCRTAEHYADNNMLTVCGVPNLATEIEKTPFALENVQVIDLLFENFIDKKIKNKRFDVIILGCTHYFFVKNKILDHFKPLKIINGEFFTAKKIKAFIESDKSLENNKGFEILFVGDNAKFNEKFFNFSGQIGRKTSKKN